MTSDRFELQLTIRKEWRLAERARRALSRGFELPWSEPARSTLAMVVSELLENAIKYGTFGVSEATSAGRLLVRGTLEAAEVIVEHPVAADSEDVDRLFSLLARLADAESAEAAYLELLSQVALDDARVSGLGLARICYEARCTLKAERIAAERLRISTTVPAHLS